MSDISPDWPDPQMGNQQRSLDPWPQFEPLSLVHNWQEIKSSVLKLGHDRSGG
jgi:hypothetical protein